MESLQFCPKGAGFRTVPARPFSRYILAKLTPRTTVDSLTVH